MQPIRHSEKLTIRTNSKLWLMVYVAKVVGVTSYRFINAENKESWMIFEIQTELECPHCCTEQFICIEVPLDAWDIGGAYFSFKEKCNSCDKDIDLIGEVESRIELS